MPNHLFVYGTLGPKQSHEHLVTRVPGLWKPASIKANLYPQGIGPTFGYPVIIPDTNGDTVAGYVYFSRQLNKLWPVLDAYEGRGYKRSVEEVCLKSGLNVSAWVYCFDSNGR